MPGLTGVEVSRRLTYQPKIIFTTAHDEYAIAAFELGAIDYLLKPFGRERVQKALDRARTSTYSLGSADRLNEILQPHSVTRWFVREAGAIVPVLAEAIERAEGADDYVTLHVPPREYLVDIRLRDLERRLPQGSFLRVHRSHIVNIKGIARVEIQPSGRGSVVLGSGARVPVSRTGVERLRALTL
jgi:DNA-binding LytR/AlgR family response regulator